MAARVVDALGQQQAPTPVAHGVQRLAPSGASGGELDAGVAADIERARSGGAPLPSAMRSSMEGAFGADFGAVRLHANSTSDRLNDQLQAKAFTLGSDIFFSGGVPDMSSSSGQKLVAHELTHTLQQGQGADGAVQRWSLFGKKDKQPTAEERAIKEEKTEKERLQGEKEKGREQRSKMKDEIGNDPEAQRKLRDRFDDALKREQTLKQSYIDKGMDPEKADTKAYGEVWLKADPDLRAIRPMRETRAEKLVAQTTEMRTEQSSLAASKESVLGSRGSLVSKKVEELYIKEVRLTRELVERGLPLDAAKREAAKRAWADADPKVLEKRPPMGSKLDKAAYALAEKRANLPDFESTSKSTVVETIGTVGKGVTKGTGGVGKGVNKLFDDKNKKTLSTGEKVGGGMESISTMVSGVLDSVVGIKQFVEYVMSLTNQKSVDYNDIGEAIKLGLNQLNQLNSNASAGMKIAMALSESQLANLTSKIPIVDVIGHAISIASGMAESIPNAMRYGSNLGDVYLARSGARPELVLPLQRLGQRNLQLLEQSIYKTVSAATKLGLSIAQLANGGADFGATTALKYVVTGLDAAHSVAHLIADNVFAYEAKKARTGLIARDEGSAENLLRKDAGYAVDALITAALKGDKKTQWLARGALKDSYGIEFVKGDAAEIAAAHDRVLKILQESDNPKTTLDKIKDGIASVKSKAGAMSDKAIDTGTLAKAREAKDGKKRGFGWRMKMWFKSEGALARRIAQENVENGDEELETSKQRKSAKLVSKGEDKNITRPQVQDKLIKEMESMSLDELQAAAKDPKRSQLERIIFSQAVAEKLKAQLQDSDA